MKPWRRWRLVAVDREGCEGSAEVWNSRPEWFLTRAGAVRVADWYVLYQDVLDLPVSFYVARYDRNGDDG